MALRNNGRNNNNKNNGRNNNNKNNGRLNCKKAEEVARMVLEMNHEVNGLVVKANQENCHISAIVDLTREQVLELVINSKTGKIVHFSTI